LSVERLAGKSVITRSPNGRIAVLKETINILNGPVKFPYVVTYRAEEGDEFWSFLRFDEDKPKFIKPHDVNRERELIETFGPQACAAAHNIAEKPQKVPEYLFKSAQLSLPI
jgi:hypothetical protein